MALSVPLLLSACGKTADNAAGGDAPAATAGTSALNAGPTIELTELKFTPEAGTAKVGQVVTWKNNGSAKHQVQEEARFTGQPDFDSPLLKPGDQYSFTPTAAGSYTYFCRIHPEDMRGTLTVTN